MARRMSECALKMLASHTPPWSSEELCRKTWAPQTKDMTVQFKKIIGRKFFFLVFGIILGT